MRVLITGGAGFIGSAVCRRAAHLNGWNVLVLDSLTYAGHRSSLASVTSSPNFELVVGDICDAALLGEVFATFQPDAVLHLAAESHVDRSISDPQQFITTNILGTFRLLEAARDYCVRGADKRAGFRFHYVSTDEIFGTLDGRPAFTEQSRISPNSPYAASKAAAGHLVSAWQGTYGLPATISNCSNNYGPYQLPEKLIPLAILNALEEKQIPIYGDGSNIRDWLFVEDHVDALLLLLQHAPLGSTFNIGGQCKRRNLEVVEQICDLVDRYAGNRNRRKLIRFVSDRPGHDRAYAIDPSKLEHLLKWKAVTTFEEGLEKTVLWYLNNPVWWQPLRQLGYGMSRLGLP
ncbi:MAG: dTDP-glucose 4,6-dehydratase [Reyranella sp.]|nr:dTDP-glucose 4,6-dehydratase [Reyranella sp.]